MSWVSCEREDFDLGFYEETGDLGCAQEGKWWFGLLLRSDF